MTSECVRSRRLEAHVLDLIGPAPGSPLDSETLKQAPSRRYLTGGHSRCSRGVMEELGE
jgi:hypothetical protein